MKCSLIIPVGTKASSSAFESFKSHGKWRSSASFSVDGLAQPVTATGLFLGPLSHVFQLMKCSCIIPVGTKASSPAFESFQSHGKWQSSASFSVGGLAQPMTATGSFPGPLSHVFQLMNCSCIIPVGTKASSPAFESFQSHGKWRSSPSFSVDGLAHDGHRVVRGTYFCMSCSY